MVKNLPANAGDEGDLSLIFLQDRTPRGGMATHFSILAWKIPWTEEPGGLQSMGRQQLDMTEYEHIQALKGVICLYVLT